MSADCWRKVKGQAERLGLTDRTLRPHLKNGLRHIRLPSGTILIKDSWADQYLEQFEVTPDDSVDQIVKDVLKDF